MISKIWLIFINYIMYTETEKNTAVNTTITIRQDTGQ